MDREIERIRGFAFDVDGVFTTGHVHLFPGGHKVRTFHSHDAYAVQRAIKAGYTVGIITGGYDEEVRDSFLQMGVGYVYLKSRYKGEVFQTFLEESGLEAHQVLYMGDDVPDLIPMQLCGLSVAPANARTEALQQAQWRTQLKGGEGCVREVIEYVMRKQNTWEQTDPTW